MWKLNELIVNLRYAEEKHHTPVPWHSLCGRAADAIEELQAQIPAWISVEERLPEAHRPVWTAIYTTDLIFVQDGETIEEAAERTQAEAEKHPRCEMGAVDEGGFWYELTFGAPMVCRPSFWMEPPKAPDLT